MQVEVFTARFKIKRQHHEVSHYGRNMGSVAAYFDLDGTLLDASSEKTLTASLLFDDHGVSLLVYQHGSFVS